MTNTGQSKRSRAYRRELNDEYQRVWGHRLPQDEKSQPYKKIGLPLVLAPFVLMACGGCVGSVPAASMLIALLASVLWLGDYAVGAITTRSYWIVFWKTPPWLVGETKEHAADRRQALPPCNSDEQYPDVYPGKIRQVLPAIKDRPSEDEHVGVALVSLTDSQAVAAGQNRIKFIDGQIEGVTFEDRFGATASSVRAQYGEEVALQAVNKFSDRDDLESVAASIRASAKALPQTKTHTGTGLYSVKVTPVNESEVQSGAVAGQVVTIVGTIAASPAFTGGYVTNTTRSQTRAIVSHTTNTATLEGDITTWANEDVLQFYDSWNSFQGACDQLFTDQGVTTYTSTQVIQPYDGTYTEDVDITSMQPTVNFPMKIIPASGQTGVIVTNTGLAAEVIDFNSTEATIIADMELRSIVDGRYGVYSSGEHLYCSNLVIYDTASKDGRGIRMTFGTVVDCTFTDLEWGIFIAYGMTCINCTFTDCTNGITRVSKMGIVSGCTFDTGTTAISWSRSQTEPGQAYSPRVTNCTFYNWTSVFYDITSSGTAGLRSVRGVYYNNIIHTATNVYYSVTDGGIDSVAGDYNTYYNCTNVASVAGVTYTLAAWQTATDMHGLASRDVNSVTTDPGLTTVASGDFSLTAESDCLHAGVGAYSSCQTGINGVDFDKWHPDKGAWSSGPGQNVAYIG